MNPTRPLVIHELLPSEIMGAIFEEHAKLEWRAPVVDGRVCRIWRQIVLSTPRAWMYLDISDEERPRIQGVREWLDRSGSAPLYIRIDKEFTFDEHLSEPSLHDLLSGYHTRIASLRLPLGDPSFFEMRDFPCLRLLDINQRDSMGFTSRPVRWDSMLALRSLRVAATDTFPLQWSELTQLEALTLFDIIVTSIPQHSQSLTTLMLDHVFIGCAISGPMAFPSLAYLSLYEVFGLKPYINAPCLVTFHEGWNEELFSSPVPSLKEYGVFYPSFDGANPATWHRYFPNLLRLSIRAKPSVLEPFLRSLSRDLHSLLALQTISVRVPYGSFTEKEQETITALVWERREACQTDLMLHFDTKPPFQLPLFFGEVSHCLSNDCECLMRILGAGNCLLKVVGPGLGHGTLTHLTRALRRYSAIVTELHIIHAWRAS
jgi:hypothetical protein